jgi:hypothetical protein
VAKLVAWGLPGQSTCQIQLGVKFGHEVAIKLPCITGSPVEGFQVIRSADLGTVEPGSYILGPVTWFFSTTPKPRGRHRHESCTQICEPPAHHRPSFAILSFIWWPSSKKSACVVSIARICSEPSAEPIRNTFSIHREKSLHSHTLSKKHFHIFPHFYLTRVESCGAPPSSTQKSHKSCSNLTLNRPPLLDIDVNGLNPNKQGKTP